MQEYMAEQGWGSKDPEDQDQVEASSSEEQEKVARGQPLGTGQGSTLALPIVASPSLSEITNPPSTKIAEPLSP